MRRLIVNADDFGFNKEVTDGIIECHKNGCVTSTTLMVNKNSAEYAVQESLKYPKLSVGIHLVLHGNGDRPISSPSAIPALVNKDGMLRSAGEIIHLAKHFKLPVRQIETEFASQLQKFLSFGISPTHCDSHQNITVNPQPCIAMMRVLEKFGVKKMRTYRGCYKMDKSEGWEFNIFAKTFLVNMKRMPKILYYEFLHRCWQLKGFRLPDQKFGFYKVVSSPELEYDIDSWNRLLIGLPKGVTELVTHPGYYSNDVTDSEHFRRRRLTELELFSNPKTKEMCFEHGVELINYTQI